MPKRILVICAFSMFVVGALAASEVHAQVPKQDKAAQRAPAAPAAPTAPVRTETIVYGAWIVTCQDTVGGKTKKTCSAKMNVAEEKSRRNLLVWVIGRNDKGVLTTFVQVPTGGLALKDGAMLNAVEIQKGIEVKIGKAQQLRKLPFIACAPGVCEANAPMDDAFVKDIMAATDATITFYNSAGQDFSFTLPTNGFDKAIAEIGR